MRPWYVGESRALSLLKYAQGVLAQYAYRVPYDAYQKAWNILATQIPLWVEERRGPRHPVTGLPLSLESDFKKYIDWWVGQLVAQDTGKENKVGGSQGFVKKVFGDPAAGVFGTSRVQASAPVRVKAGAAEDALADELNTAFQAMMDSPTQVSPTTVAQLLEYGLKTLIALEQAYAAKGPQYTNELQSLRAVMYTWMQKLFNSWVTASTVPTGETNALGQPVFHSGLSDPNWANQWKLPTGEYIYGLEGEGKQDAVKDVLVKVLQLAYANYAGGVPLSSTEATALSQQNVTFPDVNTLRSMGVLGQSEGVPLLNLGQVDIAGLTTGYVAGEDFPRTAAEIFNMETMGSKIGQAVTWALGKIDAVKETLVANAIKADAATYATGRGNVLTDAGRAAWRTMVNSVFRSIVGVDWPSAIPL
jgi:hypothetical protein